MTPMRELVAFAAFTPAAVGVLYRHEPVDGAPDARRAEIDARGIHRAQHRPRAVDVIHAPASVPASVALLRTLQERETSLDGTAVFRLAELREHADAPCRDVGRRRIKQRTM